jgi:hypothetical protein
MLLIVGLDIQRLATSPDWNPVNQVRMYSQYLYSQAPIVSHLALGTCSKKSFFLKINIYINLGKQP